MHQQEGREQPGAWCPFRLSDWVERSGMSHSQLQQIRQRLGEEGFLWYEADAAEEPTRFEATIEGQTQALPSEDVAAPAAPRLEGQALLQALFATLARLFTNGDPRHLDLERGKFNRAIKNFVFAGLQPDDLPALKAAFERLWPRATCTALGLANNLPLLMGTAEGMGWQFQPAEATP